MNGHLRWAQRDDRGRSILAHVQEKERWRGLVQHPRPLFGGTVLHTDDLEGPTLYTAHDEPINPPKGGSVVVLL